MTDVAKRAELAGITCGADRQGELPEYMRLLGGAVQIVAGEVGVQTREARQRTQREGQPTSHFSVRDFVVRAGVNATGARTDADGSDALGADVLKHIRM